MHTNLFRWTPLAFVLAATCVSGQTPLGINEARRLAAANAPQLQAQSAALRAAESATLSAGEQADPKLIVGVDNVPTDGADRFTFGREFMTMRKIGVMQDFTRGEKLRLREERAGAEVRKEAAVLSLAQVNLQRDVALAWIDRYFAERQIDLIKELARESELQVSAAQATLAGGKGVAADPLAARVAVAQLADRITDAERLAVRARSQLARWVGVAASRPLDAAPDFTKMTMRHADLIGAVDTHPHLAMYAPMQAMADIDAQQARAAASPDWSLEVAFAQRGPAFSNMLSIGVKIDLPIFQSRRQEPAIAARLALAEQVRAQSEDARRAHVAEIEGMLADWDAAGRRARRYADELLPLARERTALSLAAYRGGKGELGPVLEARRSEIDMRVNQLMAQADLARAWAQLNFLLLDKKDPS